MGERKLRDIIEMSGVGWWMETLQCEYRYRPFASAQLFTGASYAQKDLGVRQQAIPCPYIL